MVKFFFLIENLKILYYEKIILKNIFIIFFIIFNNKF